jgi:aldehyde:ferredoxin oxidoreductase
MGCKRHIENHGELIWLNGIYGISLLPLTNFLMRYLAEIRRNISSRMGKHVAKHDCPFCNFMCGLLNLIQKDHCVKSIEADEGKDQVFKG